MFMLNQLTGFGASQQGGGGALDAYYLELDKGGASQGITIDSSGRLLLAGYYDVYSSGPGVFIRLTTAQAVDAQKKNTGGSYASLRSISTNSSNDIYACHSGLEGVIKYTDAGTLSWHKKMTTYGLYTVAASDDSGCFCTGYDDIAKFASDGSGAWRKQFTNSYGTDISVVAGGNVYFCGYYRLTTNYGIALGFTQAGAQLFAKKIANGSFLVNAFSCRASANSVYVGGLYYYASTSTRGFIIRFDPSGNVIWNYAPAGVTTATHLFILGVDSGDNVYIAIKDTVASYNVLYIVKINSAGTVVFTRILKINGVHASYVSGAVDTTGMYIAINNFKLFKLPLDGSLTGVYSLPIGVVTYAVESARTLYAGPAVTDLGITFSSTSATTSDAPAQTIADADYVVTKNTIP